jgi:hypothetical protein
VQRETAIHIRHLSPLTKHLQQVLHHRHAGLVVEHRVVQRETPHASVPAGGLCRIEQAQGEDIEYNTEQCEKEVSE